jgi:hypothetical protein
MSTPSPSSFTPGRLVYLGWYQPLAAIRRSFREGGPLNQWRTACGRQEMEQAAARLPPLSPPAADAPEICFLTGRRFWFQTAFCFWSLCRHAGRPLRAVIYDDGSLDAARREECMRVFPGARLVTAAEIETRLDLHLPAARFPTLRARRLAYPNLRKLTDVHAGGRGWRLVLDSDMIFFRRPDALLAWLDAPSRPLHMADVQDAYGYSPALLRSLAGGPVPSRINVGICGLRSDAIDWDRLEYWNRSLIAAEGLSYYEEQALTALMLAGGEAECLPAADYRLMPGPAECRRPTAVLHHYVDLSKRGYFREAWRQVETAPVG